MTVHAVHYTYLSVYICSLQEPLSYVRMGSWMEEPEGNPDTLYAFVRGSRLFGRSWSCHSILPRLYLRKMDAIAKTLLKRWRFLHFPLAIPPATFVPFPIAGAAAAPTNAAADPTYAPAAFNSLLAGPLSYLKHSGRADLQYNERLIPEIAVGKDG